jgi:hypothetical protein
MGRLSTIALLFMIGALALAGCAEESPEDMARKDGKEFGEAVRAVLDVDSVEELKEAIQAVDEAADALSENLGSEERAQVERLVNDVNAVLGGLRDATVAESDEEAREAATSALAEVPTLLVSLAAISADDSILKAAAEGFIEGLGF